MDKCLIFSEMWAAYEEGINGAPKSRADFSRLENILKHKKTCGLCINETAQRLYDAQIDKIKTIRNVLFGECA